MTIDLKKILQYEGRDNMEAAALEKLTRQTEVGSEIIKIVNEEISIGRMAPEDVLYMMTSLLSFMICQFATDSGAQSRLAMAMAVRLVAASGISQEDITAKSEEYRKAGL